MIQSSSSDAVSLTPKQATFTSGDGSAQRVSGMLYAVAGLAKHSLAKRKCAGLPDWRRNGKSV